MKKLFSLSTILLIAFVFIYSCSTEEEDTTPPPSVVATPEPEPPAPTQYTLTVSAGEGGTVSTEGGTFDEGTEVTITATPDEGYEFIGWEGSNSDSNSLTVTLNGNTSVQALFEALFISKSERFLEINETTGYYKIQEFFTEYQTQDYISTNIDILDWARGENDDLIQYRTFGKSIVVTDIDGDSKQDLIAVANSFCINHPDDYSYHPSKLVIIHDYKGFATKEIINLNASYTVTKLEVNDFNSDGISDVMMFKHDTYKNTLSEQESAGGFTNNPPGKSTIVYYDNSIKTVDVGIPGDSHYGTSGDVDNDGDIDFVYWPIPGEYNGLPTLTKPHVAINNGDFNFSTEEIVFSERWTATAYDLFDVNNDNFLDLIVGWRVGPVRGNDDGYTNLLTGPVLILGDGSGNFNLNNSILLNVTYLTDRDIQCSLLGLGYTDFDKDGDIDIILSTTRAEPTGIGTFEEFTYYDNYYLILLENNNGNFIDVTDEKIDGSFNQNGEVSNFYMVRTIDKDDDGNFEIVPDNFAQWGTIIAPSNLYWENTGGQFIRR